MSIPSFLTSNISMSNRNLAPFKVVIFSEIESENTDLYAQLISKHAVWAHDSKLKHIYSTNFAFGYDRLDAESRDEFLIKCTKFLIHIGVKNAQMVCEGRQRGIYLYHVGQEDSVEDTSVLPMKQHVWQILASTSAEIILYPDQWSENINSDKVLSVVNAAATDLSVPLVLLPKDSKAIELVKCLLSGGSTLLRSLIDVAPIEIVLLEGPNLVNQLQDIYDSLILFLGSKVLTNVNIVLTESSYEKERTWPRPCHLRII